MRKGLNFILVLFLIGAFGIFTGAGGEALAADKTIKVGVNSENPPWIFSKDGKMTGFEADILEEFAKRAGYKIDDMAISHWPDCTPVSTVAKGADL